MCHTQDFACHSGYHLQGKNKWLGPSTFRGRGHQTWTLVKALKIQFARRQAAKGSEGAAPSREQTGGKEAAQSPPCPDGLRGKANVGPAGVWNGRWPQPVPCTARECVVQ